jgi:4-carboxymuconolactone decarboxylase
MNKPMYNKGLAIRRAVLGNDYVDAQLKNADEFNRPMQELVTEYCWGAVWGREGLNKKTRSMLNLAMISILNRPHELKAHLRGALRNGVTKAEIREIFLQVAIYGGVPAAVDSFRIAREVFADKPPQPRQRVTAQIQKGGTQIQKGGTSKSKLN